MWVLIYPCLLSCYTRVNKSAKVYLKDWERKNMTKKEQVTFPGRHFDLVGEIQFPDNFDSSKKYAAIVVSHPGSSNLD